MRIRDETAHDAAAAAALIAEAFAETVYGDPAYYRRFGFVAGHGLTLAGAPAGYFMALPFMAGVPTGEVRFHPAFDVASPGGSG